MERGGKISVHFASTSGREELRQHQAVHAQQDHQRLGPVVLHVQGADELQTILQQEEEVQQKQDLQGIFILVENDIMHFGS